MISALVTTALTPINHVGFSFSAADQTDGTAEQLLNATVPASSTDAAISYRLTVLPLALVVVLADKDCTVKVNDATTPQVTINLKANRPYLWDGTAGYYPCPFTVDVTGLYVTTTDETSLQIYTLIHT